MNEYREEYKIITIWVVIISIIVVTFILTIVPLFDETNSYGELMLLHLQAIHTLQKKRRIKIYKKCGELIFTIEKT